ncbi:MAG: hypothetical protein KatS3mg028_0748 [Bacteroidia bacterium]|nr:MAG: hypothetical protein KatS3mg028_0748 [Bacteroidia bacterium]
METNNPNCIHACITFATGTFIMFANWLAVTNSVTFNILLSSLICSFCFSIFFLNFLFCFSFLSSSSLDFSCFFLLFSGQGFFDSSGYFLRVWFRISEHVAGRSFIGLSEMFVGIFRAIGIFGKRRGVCFCNSFSFFVFLKSCSGRTFFLLF